jgi:hypothetical protein
VTNQWISDINLFGFRSKPTKKTDLLNLKNYREVNWEIGLKLAYEDGVFITPQIGEWTLITGWGMNMGGSKEEILDLEILLNGLSAEFEEAHFFGTHRVVEFQSWMKSVNGKMVRAYTYVGEQGETIRVLGEPTKAEEELILFDTLSDEAKNEEYFERTDLTYADEMLVMEIAEKWSVNPTKLTERSDIKNELGLVGN